MSENLYEAIAAAIHRSVMAVNIGKKKSAEYALRLVATDLAATMSTDNPGFDRETFIKACGFGIQGTA